MSWTAPRTWIAGETPTAALLNTHLRDNMLETEGAKATGGGYFVGSAANAITERKPVYEIQAGTRTTTSTTYTTGSGSTACSVSASTSDRALVMWSAMFENSLSDEDCWASIDISGATTVAADDANALAGVDNTGGRDRQYMRAKLFFSLTPGTNVFTMHHRVTGGTGSWSNRRIFVMPL